MCSRFSLFIEQSWSHIFDIDWTEKVDVHLTHIASSVQNNLRFVFEIVKLYLSTSTIEHMWYLITYEERQVHFVCDRHMCLITT